MAPSKPSSRVPVTINEYTVLPLTVPSTHSFPTPTKHHLYLRANAPKIPTETTAREVFAVNIPVDATEAHIRSLFADQLGGPRVESVEFEGARTGASRKVTAPVAPAVKKSRKRKRAEDGGEDGEGARLLPETWDREVRRSGSTCVILFVDESSRDVALREARKASKSGREVVWGQGVEGRVPALGLSRYTTHHALRYPSHSTLQQNVDAYMTHFSSLEATRARALAAQRSVPDEDGFVTVTRGGRAGPARQEEAQEKAEKQKEKRAGKEDFYRFQLREKRKERAGDLLRGFEEDRKRVEAMKGKRNKFKPN